jgi:hypothetical protein
MTERLPVDSDRAGSRGTRRKYTFKNTQALFFLLFFAFSLAFLSCFSAFSRCTFFSVLPPPCFLALKRSEVYSANLTQSSRKITALFLLSFPSLLFLPFLLSCSCSLALAFFFYFSSPSCRRPLASLLLKVGSILCKFDSIKPSRKNPAKVCRTLGINL